MTVRIGQVWGDLDKRRAGRFVVVLDIKHREDQVICLDLSSDRDVSIDRYRLNKRFWLADQLHVPEWVTHG